MSPSSGTKRTPRAEKDAFHIKIETDKEYDRFMVLKSRDWKAVRAAHLKINFQVLYLQLEEAV